MAAKTKMATKSKMAAIRNQILRFRQQIVQFQGVIHEFRLEIYVEFNSVV